MNRTLPTLALLAILAPLHATGGAADDSFLSRLAGNWIGRGAVLQSATADPERVYCKITNTLAADGNALDQKGRCSLASNSGKIDGTITALGNNAYGGTLASLASRGAAALSGSLSGNRLVLTATYTDKLSGKPVEATNTLTIVSGGYRLKATRVDPKTGESFTSSDIVFTDR